MTPYRYELPPPHMRQEPSVRSRRLALVNGESQEQYIAMYGTDGEEDAFATEASSPFARTMASEHFVPVVDILGRTFAPYAGLDGLPFSRHRVWNGWANALIYFASRIAYDARHVIAFSHAGQAVWKAASVGFKFRSVTFVGTPNRSDVGADIGIKHIGMAQVIYDDTFDLMGSLGAWFDPQCSSDRSFASLGAQIRRYPRSDIGHGKILHDEQYIALWRTEPWLQNMRDTARDVI